MVINMNKYKPIFKNYQLTKFLQIGFSLILLVLDILLMVLYPDYRNKLSENPLYFIPQLIVILFIIGNLLFLVVDLTAFGKAVQERDTLKHAAMWMNSPVCQTVSAAILYFRCKAGNLRKLTMLHVH